MDAKAVEILSELKTVMGHEFDRAKFWWGASVGLQCGGIVAATAMAFIDSLNPFVSLFAAASLPLIAVGCRWVSDIKRGRADAILREVEFLDAYGGNVRARSVANALAAANLTRAAVRTLEKRIVQPEWATNESHGPTRALRNTRESAWWSQQLALVHFRHVLLLLLGVAIVWVVFGFAALAISVPDDLKTAVAKTSLAFISLLLSVGFVKLAFDYHAFSTGASRVVERCEQILAHAHTEVEAVRVLADYQLLRNRAPPLFSFVHRGRQQEMNAQWRDVESLDR